MKPVFKCDCCQNCKYSRKEQYNISNGFKNLDTSYYCFFHEHIYDPNVIILYIGKQIPKENICEHYERRKPERIIIE
jgi:hypothetical protein